MQLEREAWARPHRPGNEFVFCFQSNENPLKDFKQRNDESDSHFKKITWLRVK